MTETHNKLGATLVAVALIGLGIAGCEETGEQNQTYHNRVAINSAIPVPIINFSLRRWVLAEFYKMLEQPRLETCTIITSRGGDKTELAVAPTYGSPVNLSNQMTAPTISEPDSIYSSNNDQTIVVLRNGIGVVVEGDSNAVLGECPADLKKPATALQSVIDYNMRVQHPQFNFLQKKW